jgi:putative radical SAM enzyme (TIGR03279 family)
VVEYQLPKLRVAGSNPVARSTFSVKEAKVTALPDPTGTPTRAKNNNKRPAGVVIKAVHKGSPADDAGLKVGDRILDINGMPIEDFLDLYAASFDQNYVIEYERGRAAMTAEFEREPGVPLGVDVEMGEIYSCRNECVFCFFDQMPKGLRPELYFKDEDYRLSFLHGNYLALTNLKPEDEERIIAMRLSPLYVSVHATHPEVRERMLGKRPPEDVRAVMKRLGDKGIQFHAQIVVVPGYNAGEILRETIKDLVEMGETVLSVGVVPVGLTAHREGLPEVAPVDAEIAKEAVRTVRGFNHRMRQRTGKGVVYAADELFIKAGMALPRAPYYDDFPQVENGIGMLRLLLDSARGAIVPETLRDKWITFVTGTLAKPYLVEIAGTLRKEGLIANVLAPHNSLFGDIVTVSGLLPGKDVLALKPKLKGFDAVVLPPDMLNAGGLTLDGMTVEDLEKEFGLPVVPGSLDVKDILDELEEKLGD